MIKHVIHLLLFFRVLSLILISLLLNCYNLFYFIVVNVIFFLNKMSIWFIVLIHLKLIWRSRGLILFSFSSGSTKSQTSEKHSCILVCTILFLLVCFFRRVKKNPKGSSCTCLKRSRLVRWHFKLHDAFSLAK